MKIKKSLIIASLLFFGAVSFKAFSQEKNKISPNNGDWKTGDGKYFAKVFTTKEGVLTAVLTKDLISESSQVAVLKVTTNDNNTFELNGNGWTGKIADGKLAITGASEKLAMTKFYRKSPTINAVPPKDAIILFNGKDLNAWSKALEKDWLDGSGPADNWKINSDGSLEVLPHKAGEYESILTKKKFGDLKLHLEFRLLGEVTNGGVYFMSRYEMNIKDAYSQITGTPIGFGNISKPKDLYPNVNVAFPPMEWQTFDIDFIAPRFDATGTKKTENARITVVHNGVTIYKDVQLEEVKGSTAKLGEAAVGPLYLQEHGAGYQFRNIWVIDKTLKGTDSFQTLTSESKENSKEATNIETKKGGKSGGKKGGGKKKAAESETGTALNSGVAIAEEVKKGGGKKKAPESGVDSKSKDNSTEATNIETKKGGKSGGKKGGGKKKAAESETGAAVDIENTGVAMAGKVKKGGNKSKMGGTETSAGASVADETKKGGSKTADQPAKKKGSSKKAKDASYAGEKNPAYEAVTVIITPDLSGKPAKPAGFIHPGVLLNRLQLDEIKRRVAKGIEPQKSAFEDLKNSKYGAIDYAAQPRDTVSCGPYSNPNLGCKEEQNDCAAAYAQSLLWVITGNKVYAENAIKIMNAWSTNLVGGHNYANGPVQSAWSGSVWPRAAEIIRYTYTGWPDKDIAKFQNMLRTQYVPTLIHGDCENGNKELAMSEALINIGVFNDDRGIFDLGLKMWRGRTPAYIYLKTDGLKPIDPPGCGPAIWSNKGLMPELVDGLMQETARDSHHPWMAFASMVNGAETAYQQGVDLYKEQGKRMMAALEFQAKYLEPNNFPKPANLDFAKQPTWEIAYNHLVNRMGNKLPYMAKVLPTNRPSIGNNHHMLWEDLTHAEIGNMGLPTVTKK